MIIPSKIQLMKTILESTNHNSPNTEVNINNSKNYLNLIETNKLVRTNYSNIEPKLPILIPMIDNKWYKEAIEYKKKLIKGSKILSEMFIKWMRLQTLWTLSLTDKLTNLIVSMIIWKILKRLLKGKHYFILELRSIWDILPGKCILIDSWSV